MMAATRCSTIGRRVLGICVSRTVVALAIGSVALLMLFVGYAAAVGPAETGRDGRGTILVPLAPEAPDIGLPPGHPPIDVLPPGHPPLDGDDATPGVEPGPDGPVYSL